MFQSGFEFHRTIREIFNNCRNTIMTLNVKLALINRNKGEKTNI
jgi:hypothetical protein